MATMSVYVDPLLRRQKIEDMSPDEFISIPIAELHQSGPLVAGPGAIRDVAASILGVALPKLDRRDQDYVARGKKYAMEQSIKYVLMKQTLAHQQQSWSGVRVPPMGGYPFFGQSAVPPILAARANLINSLRPMGSRVETSSRTSSFDPDPAQQAKSLQRHQALVLMCRVYIGSISFELREDTIRQAFAPFGFIIRMEFGKTGPIKTINMSWDPVAQKHKGFAFVEYDLPEAAQLALEQMNGVMIGGRNIKCGRDTRIKFSHMDQVIDDLMDEAKAYHRIYVASIHPDLTEEDIKSVFEAFGKIKACKLAPGPSAGKHRGYGFIEYETAEAAAESITSMNLFDLGGQYLRVGKAITPPNALQANPGQSQMPTAAAVAAAAATAKIQAMEAVTNTAAAFGLTKEASLPNVLSPTASAPLANAGISPRAVINPPQLINPTLGSLGGLANSPSAPVNLPPPGLAILPASVGGGGLGLSPVTPSVPTPVGVPFFSQSPSMGMNAANISTPQVPTTPTMVAPPYSGLHHLSTAGTVPSLVADIMTMGVGGRPELSSSREELVKRLVEENESLSLSAQENVSIKGQSARHLVMQKLMRSETSPVIVLKNMVDPEDVDDSLQDEIMEECSRFGTVERVLIYQETQSEEENAPVVVKIFVEFVNTSEAEAARSSLNGRFFGGRVVICEIYDFSMYQNHDLSG